MGLAAHDLFWTGWLFWLLCLSRSGGGGCPFGSVAETVVAQYFCWCLLVPVGRPRRQGTRYHGSADAENGAGDGGPGGMWCFLCTVLCDLQETGRTLSCEACEHLMIP